MKNHYCKSVVVYDARSVPILGCGVSVNSGINRTVDIKKVTCKTCLKAYNQGLKK